ncbi:MAG: SMI1/KNR4 family protein [Oscillospiraceae bacterium]
MRFSTQLKSYLTDYGFIEFFGVELYGISKEDFSSSVFEGNIVEWALNERETNDLDPMWLPIRFEDDGEMAFPDFNQLNGEGEPPVILAEDNGDGYEFVEKLANDLGDYIFELVNTQLEEQ